MKIVKMRIVLAMEGSPMYTYFIHIGVMGRSAPHGINSITSFLQNSNKPLIKRQCSPQRIIFVCLLINSTNFFLLLNALASNTFRFLVDLVKHGVVGGIEPCISGVVSKSSAEPPMAPTIFRNPLNMPANDHTNVSQMSH